MEIMSSPLKGTLETILVVEDTPSVLKVVVTILEHANFLVLSASSGPAAIKLAAGTDQPIHLLLSDMDMPQMSGPAVGETLKKDRPEMHVMLMSGRHERSLLVLHYGWAFIRKPFVPKKLVEMVTDVLHSANRSQLGDSRNDTAVNRDAETSARMVEFTAKSSTGTSVNAVCGESKLSGAADGSW
jgi:DNA-binding NtrC family response regulator